MDLPTVLGLEAVEPIEEVAGLLKEPGPVLVAVGFQGGGPCSNRGPTLLTLEGLLPKMALLFLAMDARVASCNFARQ